MAVFPFRIVSTIFAIFLLGISAYPQIVFQELPATLNDAKKLEYLEKSPTRSIILLNGTWKVFKAGEDGNNSVSVKVPSQFEGEIPLVFEKRFSLSEQELNSSVIEFNFSGISYSAEISINNLKNVYRHPGGDFPFSFTVTRNALHSTGDNVISVTIYPALDSKNSLPVKQSFLFPEQHGGIFRDVFIKKLPTVFMGDFSFTAKTTPQSSTIRVKTLISHNDFKKGRGENYKVVLTVQDAYGSIISSPSEFSTSVSKGRDLSFDQSFTVSGFRLWEPSTPVTYLLSAKLVDSSGVVDEIVKPISFFNYGIGSEGPELNGKPFLVRGVTYIASNLHFGKMASYAKMESDMRLIQELGFNSVRFAYSTPHPYLLYLASKLGLLAFIELPIGIVPTNLITGNLYTEKSKNFLISFAKSYKNFPSVAAIGLGSGYKPSLAEHTSFLSALASTSKSIWDKPVYALFDEKVLTPISGIDFYGIQLLNTPVNEIDNEFRAMQESLGKARVFIGSASYFTSNGSSDGYTNEFSNEAQAKYYDDLFSYTDEINQTGFFIHSMFDYRAEFHSIISGYTFDKIVHLGILGEDRNTNRLSYRTLYARLHNQERITIPLGAQSDSAPMVFVIYGLFIALLVGFLFNSGRKFREDASRALLRPYNFFADIRDQRIISGFQTTVMALIISSVVSLLLSSVLASLKNNIFFEQVLLSLGSGTLMKFISYLAWNPFQALLILTPVIFIKLLLLTVLLKFASVFVQTKVDLGNSYFAAIWSFLPFVLTTPLAIILYKILGNPVVAPYVYALLLLFVVWSLMRLIKGIYVIFDIRQGVVYFYSFVVFALVIGLILLYFHVTNAALDYLIYTISEFKVRI